MFDPEEYLLKLGDRVAIYRDDECVFSLFLDDPEFEEWYKNKKNERTEDTSKPAARQAELGKS